MRGLLCMLEGPLNIMITTTEKKCRSKQAEGHTIMEMVDAQAQSFRVLFLHPDDSIINTKEHSL